MIRDLSLSLRSMLVQANVPSELATAQIAFDRPGDTFAPGQTTVSLFLYDIREHRELRDVEPIVQVDRKNGTAVRRPPPLRVACTYLITAWPVGGTGAELPLQEHRLLSQALVVFGNEPTIPSGCLQGSLKDQDLPPPLAVARGDLIKNPSEFWSGLGGKMRPSVILTATLAFGLEAEEPIKIVRVKKQDVRMEQILPDSGRGTRSVPGGAMR
jgi:hypothetical protein